MMEMGEDLGKLGPAKLIEWHRYVTINPRKTLGKRCLLCVLAWHQLAQGVELATTDEELSVSSNFSLKSASARNTNAIKPQIPTRKQFDAHL